jgi:hypothetical protein
VIKKPSKTTEGERKKRRGKKTTFFVLSPDGLYFFTPLVTKCPKTRQKSREIKTKHK